MAARQNTRHIGDAIRVDLTGGMAGPGKIVRIAPGGADSAPSYLVEFRVWPGEPVKREWMSEQTLNAYARMEGSR